jgi:hypothetical protein
MRNILAILVLSALGSAWAADQQGPLVGPGVVGEKDEKGGVKGADAGAGPHLRYNHMQLERRVDRPEEAVEKENREKGVNARSQGQEGPKPAEKPAEKPGSEPDSAKR